MDDKNCTRLRMLMAQHRLTAEQVGAMLNRKSGIVYQWRRGYREIPDELLELLLLKIKIKIGEPQRGTPNEAV